MAGSRQVEGAGLAPTEGTRRASGVGADAAGPPTDGRYLDDAELKTLYADICSDRSWP